MLTPGVEPALSKPCPDYGERGFSRKIGLLIPEKGGTAAR